MAYFLFQSLISTFASLCSLAVAHNVHDHVVDLGYAQHRPTFSNVSVAGVEILSYNNIRFAQPPTGERRFRNPQGPPFKQTGIQDGAVSNFVTDCLSSAPAVVPFPEINGTAWGSEDCLFLNVIKPKHVKKGDKVAVLHWVAGSAYAFGGKDFTGFYLDPLGLFDKPLNSTDKFIYVANNYRLGIPGFTPAIGDNMDNNVGLRDSVAALEWTKKYIHHFGGDPERITVMGESAGAGLITLMLTGNGGNTSVPFHQALFMSPALPPRRNISRAEYLYNRVLSATNCTAVECLKNITEDSLKAANNYLVSEVIPEGGGGNFGPGPGFSPIVDGSYVPDLPSKLLEQGRFNHKVRSIIVGTMADEVGVIWLRQN
jgi:carboxylesterase type B